MEKIVCMNIENTRKWRKNVLIKINLVWKDIHSDSYFILILCDIYRAFEKE